MSLSLAFKAFFAALSGGPRAEAMQAALEAESVDAEQPRRVEEKVPQEDLRSDAVALLAALQRETRLIDLIQEPLEQFTDAQIGAAARPCLQDCARVVARMFAIKPLVESAEGEEVEVDSARPTRCRVVGSHAMEHVSRGRLVHHGWIATKQEVPKWTGPKDDSMVIAPAEVDIG